MARAPPPACRPTGPSGSHCGAGARAPVPVAGRTCDICTHYDLWRCDPEITS